MENIKLNNALIIGATSSLAYCMCHELARNETNLIISGRDKIELDKLASDLTIRHNIKTSVIVCNIAEDISAIENFINKNEIDLVLIAAGINQENIDDSENISENINVNFVAPAKIISLAAKKMSLKGSGRIAVISSVAGDRGRRSNYVYGSAKAGLSEFTSGSRSRYHKMGVKITTIKPGFIDTPMTYGKNDYMVHSREKAAKTIIKSILKGRDEIYVPFFWRFIMLTIKLIPEFIFKRINF